MDTKPWYKRKTVWSGVAIIITTALPQFGVADNIVAGLYAIIGGLALIFLRESIETNKQKPSQ